MKKFKLILTLLLILTISISTVSAKGAWVSMGGGYYEYRNPLADEVMEEAGKIPDSHVVDAINEYLMITVNWDTEPRTEDEFDELLEVLLDHIKNRNYDAIIKLYEESTKFLPYIIKFEKLLVEVEKHLSKLNPRDQVAYREEIERIKESPNGYQYKSWDLERIIRETRDKDFLTNDITLIRWITNLNIQSGRKPTSGYVLEITDHYYEEDTFTYVVEYRSEVPSINDHVELAFHQPMDSISENEINNKDLKTFKLININDGSILYCENEILEDLDEVHSVKAKSEEEMIREKGLKDKKERSIKERILEKERIKKLPIEEQRQMQTRPLKDRLFVYGELLEYDLAPIIENDTTLIPIREVSEALGANVEWFEEASIVIIRKGSKNIEIMLDSSIIKVNDGSYSKERRIKLIDGKTMVPLRFISNIFGDSVDFDDETHCIDIGL